MSAGNKQLLILSMVATAIFSLLPISSHAAVDWNERFEYASDTEFGTVWSKSCLGNPGISTARPFTGAKSAKEVFRGAVGVDLGAGGCFMDRKLPARSNTLYTRFYMYMENFTVNSTGTKITRHEDSVAGYPGFWWGMLFGQPNLVVSVEGIISNSGVLITENIQGGPIPQNQWVCIETRITMSTPGVDNGIVQAWINGTQVMNKTNQRMRSATLNQRNGPNVQIGQAKLYTQHGIGTIYYDDYAVSRDARIGCSGGGSTTGDLTPPSVPTGIR